MKLEAQICSLELAKIIYELGVKRDSLFYWCKNKYEKEFCVIGNGRICVDGCSFCFALYKEAEDEVYSAYTVAELGEMLPDNIFSCPSIDRKDHIHDRMYYCKDVFNKIEPINANTEANARAKMLIYLIENKLLEVKK